MRVKFTQDYTTKENTPRTFKKDQEVDFFEEYSEDETGPDTADAQKQRAARARASVAHFVNRGVAVDVEAEERKQREAGEAKDRESGREGGRQRNRAETTKPEEKAQGGQPTPTQGGQQ